MSAATTRRGMRTPTFIGVLIVLAVVLIASIVSAVTIGPAPLSPGDVFASILSHVGIGISPLTALQDGIVWQLRLPRVLTAAAVGAGLALAGGVMQALMRNPLADPYLLGLSSGASTGAVLVLVLGVSLALPIAAFGGALLALVLALGLARAAGGVSTTATVLAGLAVSAVLSAVTSLVIFWSSTGDSYREILNWLLGSLSGTGWSDVLIAVAALTITLIPLLAYTPTLDAFALGDTAVSALGVHVKRTRTVLLVVTALLTGALVSVSGSIGFIGLIVPHAVRLLVGHRNRIVLPIAALGGAVFLLWADTLARSVFDPRELPVGIITAIIGGPIFAGILIRSRKGIS